MLIDGMQGEAGAIQTGGDSGGNLEGNLPTQPPLALFSGVVKLDDQGKATVTFDLPSFNGTVRLAAVAWSKDKVGSAQADVTVRDAVVVSATLPRFLDVGDRSQMSVDIDNVDGGAGDYTLDLDLHGPLTADADALRKTLHLDAHQRRQAAIPIAAAGVGVADFDLRLTGPATDQTQRFKLGVRRARRTSIAARSRRCRAAETRPFPAISFPISSREPVRSRCRPRRSGRSTRRPCCRRSTATPTAAPSRPSAGRCRSSTPTASLRSKISGSIRTSAPA